VEVDVEVVVIVDGFTVIVSISVSSVVVNVWLEFWTVVVVETLFDVIDVDNADCNEDVWASITVIISVSSVAAVVVTLERLDVVKDSEVWLDIWFIAVVWYVVWESVDISPVIDIDEFVWLVLWTLEIVGVTLDSISAVVSNVK
jgi:hypothetical protein